MNPRRLTPRGHHRLGASFTLIELLAVVAIVTLITIMALPAMKALQSTALATATRQVANEMQLARQYAITRRVPVRFMIGVDLGSGSSKLATNLVCRAYLIAEAFRDANGATLWWTPLQNWRVLPDGVVFYEHNAETYAPLTLAAVASGSIARPLTDYDNNATLTFTNLAATSGTTNWTVCWVEFKPSGAANSQYVTGVGGGIRLAQGGMDSVGSRTLVITDKYQWTFVEYDQFGGRIRVRTPESYQ